jgi:dethiobiotin synthetase
MRRIFVTGIGTEIGKTFCSAILVEALTADYWKPVQAGELDDLDSDFVRHAISNTKTNIHPEQYLLSEPMSPHAAARIDGIHLSPATFQRPETDNHLIIEGAGGLMVPLNDEGDMIVDLIPNVADEVVLVSKNYLGSINHTLLSVELLKQRGIKITGILFNGDSNPETEKVILNYTGLTCIGKIPMLDQSLQSFVREQASGINI